MLFNFTFTNFLHLNTAKAKQGEWEKRRKKKSSQAKANAILTRTWIRLANRGGRKASDSFRPRVKDGQLRAAGSGAYSHGRGDAVRTEEFWMGVRPCGLTHSRPRESKGIQKGPPLKLRSMISESLSGRLVLLGTWKV